MTLENKVGLLQTKYLKMSLVRVLKMHQRFDSAWFKFVQFSFGQEKFVVEIKLKCNLWQSESFSQDIL